MFDVAEIFLSLDVDTREQNVRNICPSSCAEEVGRIADESYAVLVNVEWGCAGDNGCLDFYCTKYEKEVNEYSNHPNSFTFEKSFSGLYLGELVRLVLVQLTKEGALFDGHLPPSLAARKSFTTSHVTEIECDEGNDSTKTLRVLQEFMQCQDQVTETETDVAIVREVVAMISQRAAYIVAAVKSSKKTFPSVPCAFYLVKDGNEVVLHANS